MNKRNKSFIKRATNFKVPVNYIKESIQCIRQGHSLQDKIIVFLHFCKIPLFFLISLLKNKELAEVENKYKKLLTNVTLKNNDGIFFCGNNITAVYIVVEGYQKKFDHYMKLDEGIFLDIGAHIGKYTVRMAKMLQNKGRVIAMEPEKYNFSLLSKNARLNNLDNVVLINKGAFSRKDKLRFYTLGDGEGAHSILKISNEFQENEIEVETLDNIASELKLNRVDLVKIDVEGAESDVLKGAKDVLEKYHPKFIIEAWNEKYLAKVVEILKPFQYREFIKIDDTNYFFE